MLRSLAAALATLAAASGAPADDPAPASQPLQARLACRNRHVNIGEPIWIDFLIQNNSDEPQSLFVPGTAPEMVDEGTGLPLAHVFSGPAYGALSIRNKQGRVWDVAVGYQPPAKVPIVTVAAHATIGVTLNVRSYYPALRTPGQYNLKWTPYGGSLESNTVLVQVAPLKQAEILTDQGAMTVQFFYGDTPHHIDNFVELAQKGFYNNLTFHRILPGLCIQGGCPNGDGTGIRTDGIKLQGEFSDRPQTRGMVSMSRVEDDPDSASCQFFITYTRVPEWDGKYTIFGQIVGDESLEILDRLMAAETDDEGLPRERLFIRGIRVNDAPR